MAQHSTHVPDFRVCKSKMLSTNVDSILKGNIRIHLVLMLFAFWEDIIAFEAKKGYQL